MTGLPELPAANAELRRLFAAGRPPDGSTVPLMRALTQAKVVVPMHPQGGPLRMGRKHAFRDGEEVVLHAFTSHELAARWAATVKDAPPQTMSVSSVTYLARWAIDSRTDVIDFDRGSHGYGLRFRGMMDLLSRTAFDGRSVVVFESVKQMFGQPKEPPAQAVLDGIAAIARAHGIAQLSYCFAWTGEAPAEIQLVYPGHPNAAFLDELSARMNDLTRDRFTAGAHDAAESRFAPEQLKRLI